MTDRPILFNAEMVRAILAGNKTMTRRALKPQPESYTPMVIDISEPIEDEDGQWGQVVTEWERHGDNPYPEPEREIWRPLRGLRWAVGDRLWVRETWKPHSLYDGLKPRDIPQSRIFYGADDGYAPSNTKWYPSIHMPRWASRITLEVEAVRVQRLQDISEADAVAEGAYIGKASGRFADNYAAMCVGEWFATGRGWYADLWNRINGPGSWDANPWVSVTTFRRVTQENARG